MKFRVMDKKKGKEADPYAIALTEEWAQGLCYCDMDGFAILEDGTLILADECGQFEYCDPDRFEVVCDGEWIPCSERLPEDGRAVLIYAWSVHYVIARYGSFRTAENGYKKTWVTADAWNGNTEIRHEVIAWMPLPEPWKGEEDEH